MKKEEYLKPEEVAYDCDGVITVGIVPRSGSLIITGRSYEEAKETIDWLRDKSIYNQVMFNPTDFKHKTRQTSGQWKAQVIKNLGIKRFFEDDPIQAAEILEVNPNCEVIMVEHNLTEKENVRRDG